MSPSTPCLKAAQLILGAAVYRVDEAIEVIAVAAIQARSRWVGPA